jgi:hypothetical protein
MGILNILAKRAKEWPVTPVDIGSLDSTSRSLVFMSPLLHPEDIITPEEVAARLKVPESWVYEKTRARCRNPIPCLRLGRYIRFDWNAVIHWLSVEADRNSDAKRASISQKR